MTYQEKLYRTGFEISSLDDAAKNIVEDLIKKKYSYQSMLYFASQLQWYIFNIESIRNELEVKREHDMRMLRGILGRDE